MSNLSKGDRVHFVGIGGAGLSAIARVLLEQNWPVSGSDINPSPMTEALAESGAVIYPGHQAEHIAGARVVVISSAVQPDNPEVVAAQAQGIPVLKRSQFLGQLLADRTVVAVAGTHGKTTTTSMVAYVLDRAGLEPGFIIGGIAANFGTNARAGRGQVFVIEADEYDHMFLGLHPQVAVITNIEMDHPDCYPTDEDLYRAFLQFARQILPAGLLIAGYDYPGSRRVAEEVREERCSVPQVSSDRIASVEVQTYGFQPGADVTVRNAVSRGVEGIEFDLVKRSGIGESRTSIHVSLPLSGEHNASNAAAAILAAERLGVSLSRAAGALSTFQGSRRRFEIRGEAGGVTVIDDYAHHPSEIQATISAVRSRFGPRPIWAVWQPHTYSRLRALENDFVRAFDQADHVIVTDIYASRERFDPTIRAADVVAKMAHPDARYIGPLAEVAETLSREVRPGDVVITLSAGDGNLVGEWLLEWLIASG